MTTPKTVKEVVKIIFDRMTPKEKAYLKSIPQKDTIRFHHSTGRCIRNEFGLWGKNPELLNDCNEVQKEIYPEQYDKCQKLYSTYQEKMESKIHPDDASGLILDEIWRLCQ
jgi:hypothetical protein